MHGLPIPRSFDPRALVSEYVNEKFKTIAELSIEDIVEELLKQDGGHAEPLDVSIKTKLMPRLLSDATPLFYPNPNIIHGFIAGQKVMTLISVPNKCTNIYDAVREYCAANGLILDVDNANCILQRSSINNRIYVQSVLCPLPLANFDTIWNSEKIYAVNTDRRGLHLVHAVNSAFAPECRTWTDLPTLIPEEIRKSDDLVPAVKRLLDHDLKRKERIRELNSLWPALPIIELSQDAALREMVFHLSDAEISIDAEGKVMHIKCGKTSVTSFDCKQTAVDASFDELLERLNRLRSQDLASVEEINACTRSIRTKELLDPVTGDVNELRTMNNLLDTCLSAFELMRDMEIEAGKYAQLDAFIELAQREQKESSAVRKMLFNFIRLLVTDHIYITIDADDGYPAMFFLDNNEPIAVFDDVIQLDDYRLPFKMFMVFRDICENDRQEDDYLRTKINELTSSAKNVLTAARNDPAQRERILAVLNGYSAVYASLLRQPADTQAKKNYRKFYGDLVLQANMLQNSLTPARQRAVVDADEPASAPASACRTRRIISDDEAY